APVEAASGQPEAKAAQPRWHTVGHFPTFQAKVIACSPDGKRVAVGRDAASPQDAVKYFEEPVPPDFLLPGVDVLDGGTKVATLVQTSEEQEKLLAQSSAADRVQAIAVSADGNLLAIGTRIGQIELCNARTYDLIRYLDDEPGRLADKSTPAELQEIK